MNIASEPHASVEMALAHAKRLLEKNPDLAAEQAREILSVDPAHAAARLILGTAQRRGGRAPQALDVLEPLGRELPNAAPVHLELGVARAEAGDLRAGIAALRRALKLQPASADGWRILADYLEADGDVAGAGNARVQYVAAAAHDPRLRAAAAALASNDLPLADSRLRAHLAAYPTDVAALRMLAEVAGRLRKYSEAQELLERCLELAPAFDAARQNYAGVLNRQAKPAQALPQVQQLLAKEPQNPGYLNLKAAILANMGDYTGSIDVYGGVLRRFPAQPKVWMSMGHALKTAHRQEESIAAYRRAIELQPALGEAYWSLANLKTVRFSPVDRQAMQAALDRSDLTNEDRVHLEFALGKALEDEASYEQSFVHYRRGNALHRRAHPYSADENHAFVGRCKQQYSAQFLRARASQGADHADPIFIVGLPRAGSTLLEQILASHSLVEGTVELPDIPQIARELAGRDEGTDPGRFFETVAALRPADLRSLGDRYLASTRVHRKSGAPFFIDKMPNNFLYIALIHLILPRAKIIDARRHPLGCAFSAFKQHFARGQSFTYDLEDLGRYYADYVDLMAHFDRVMPGRIHRVFYESLVRDTESEVRGALEYCGLPFEAGCLKFYENERPVRTASSEQVRRPIFTDGMEHWRNYEPWLGPLKQSLGCALSSYPQIPEAADQQDSSINYSRRGQRETS